MSKLNGILLGDVMIPAAGFEKAWEKHLSEFGEVTFAGDWETDYPTLQDRRLKVEQNGPGIEPCEPLVLAHGKDCNTLMGLFIAVSDKVMDAMPNLRLVGVSRAGLENVNVAEATKRGILVFNVMGRNAHAVSDFAVGMMLAECRNIARAHNSILNNQWKKKEFVNYNFIPELHDKTIGLVGFGNIGTLVAKKLSGFDVNLIVYDPYTPAERIEAAGGKKVETLEELFSTADFVSLHARLTEQNKHMINADILKLMKPTAYLINTSRSGLIDQDALIEALREHRIMGAALDVFENEPLEPGSPFRELDNVTLTTHVAGTTADALTNSPFLLMEDIKNFLKTGEARFIVNKEVLQNPEFQAWLEEVKC